MKEIFLKEYMEFLSKAKTERECVRYFEAALQAAGYRPLEKFRKEHKRNGRKIRTGDKIYRTCMGKSLAAFRVGEAAMEQGMRILAAHLDSPRLDLKQNPLYEESGLAYLDTHYYGGIKKYQWVTLPLALHGVVIKKDGTAVQVCLGEQEEEPVFFVSDLLPHLAEEQLKKTGEKVIEGEQLNVVVGNRVVRTEDGKQAAGEKQAEEAAKAGILEILRKQYDMEEEDFFSAEIQVVPAGHAREAGLDRSMILAYGQDDKVCAFAAFRAMLDSEHSRCSTEFTKSEGPKDGPNEGENKTRTACLMLVDKEEIGSVGATGMESHFFEDTVAELLDLMDEEEKTDLSLRLRRCLSRSRMLSADVNSGFDPAYKECYEKRNASCLGGGMVLSKFSGSGGKSGGNDANPELIAWLRRIFEEENITFQMAELGRVDLGGGGTIAYIPARYGMEVIDCGIAVLNMHAPWEAASKNDICEMLRGMRTFLTAAE